jgi:hypothetical protein
MVILNNLILYQISWVPEMKLDGLDFEQIVSKEKEAQDISDNFFC